MEALKTVNKEIIEKLENTKNSAAKSISKELKKYNQMLEIDIEMAIICARKALDFMLRNACEMASIKSGTKPLENILVELNKAGSIPPIIDKHCRIIKDFGNVAAHGVNVDGDEYEDFEFSASEADICSSALTTVTSWYISKVLPLVLDIFPFEILHGNQITYERIHQAVELDELSYDQQFKANLELCYQWFLQNPEIYTFIVDKRIDKVVGYINAMPLENDVMKTIESGVSMDSEIKPEEIQPYDFPDFYKIYLCSVVIDPDYRGSIAFKMLYEAFFDKLLYLARNDIYISELVADAVTTDGEKLCKFIGMKKINGTNHNSTIFKTTLLPPSIRATTKKAKNLELLYQNKYEEFKDLLDINESAK